MFIKSFLVFSLRPDSVEISSFHRSKIPVTCDRLMKTYLKNKFLYVMRIVRLRNSDRLYALAFFSTHV